MASHAQVQNPVPSSMNKLCDYCNQKPKFGTHLYCSKTCAAQAATLCDFCHKKQKFQGFEYCGKNCAALANPPGSKGARSGAPAAGVSQQAHNGGGTYGKGGNNPNPQQQQQRQQPPPVIDPVQIAKLVVQHIPQVAQVFAPSTGSQARTAGSTAAYNPLGPAAQSVPSGFNNPFIGGVPATQQNLNNGNNKQTADDSKCLILGCGRPVHVDSKGVKISDYCSLRHREEAVTSGLKSPCIMCLSYPQNDLDYFCSRACREESMNKFLEYDYCDDEQTVVVSESEQEVDPMESEDD